MFSNEFLNEIFASSIATQAREVSLSLQVTFPCSPQTAPACGARLVAAPARPLQVSSQSVDVKTVKTNNISLHHGPHHTSLNLTYIYIFIYIDT